MHQVSRNEISEVTACIVDYQGYGNNAIAFRIILLPVRKYTCLYF